jgi:hypothetical protein
MAEEVYPAEAKGLSDRLGLGDIALDGPESGIGRLGGGTGAQLVKGDDAVSFVDQAGMGVAKIVAGKSGTAVEAEDDIVTLAELVGHHRVSVDGHLMPGLRLDLTPHHSDPQS